MLSEAYLQPIPSLGDGPLTLSAQRVVAAACNLGMTRWASLIRTWAVPYLFDGMERIFSSGHEPTEPINDLLDSLYSFLSIATTTGFAEVGRVADDVLPAVPDDSANLLRKTGDHYGRLFECFSPSSFWNEPTHLLRVRLERNCISQAQVAGKDVLDAGCGGGRYTVAWRMLGARQVVGLDVSTSGLSDACSRVCQAQVDGVRFGLGHVLDLPFSDSTFDIVFSNGVLHHTADWKRGVRELVRVLKPDGLGWIYLIENPGGLFWDVIEILRVIMRNEHSTIARTALQVLGLPANRVFYLLDHVLVPINLRLTPAEIEDCLAAAGATDVRRLNRGTDSDRIEQVYQRKPFAEIKYGVGENRYVFTKRGAP